MKLSKAIRSDAKVKFNIRIGCMQKINGANRVIGYRQTGFNIHDPNTFVITECQFQHFKSICIGCNGTCGFVGCSKYWNNPDLVNQPRCKVGFTLSNMTDVNRIKTSTEYSYPDFQCVLIHGRLDTSDSIPRHIVVLLDR